MKTPRHLQSKDNPRLKQLRGLLEQASTRRKLGQTVLEGIHLLDAYQRTNQTPTALYATATALLHPEVSALRQGWPDVDVYVLPEANYQEIRTLGQGVDIMGVIEQPVACPPISIHSDVLILENVQDSGNVGTLLRTAAAAGVRLVLCTTGTASIWSPRVLRAGMGAQFSLDVIEHVDLAEWLPKLQVPLYTTCLDGQSSLYSLSLAQPVAWLMGNEGQGASTFALTHSHTITIPQPGGQESLNVAVAGAVCLFEMVRQRLS